ncbi:MAG: putative nucleotidyltransferase with HDIG domain [Planctomycetota bacterium]|jgi:putative nucleotidyltransferase with HDIG domain
MKRILFVDDEQSILNGLQRILHKQRHVWDMQFATSGKDALAAMDLEPFDVVVTDMRMPGMNGAELLREVKARHPRTVRIVLSGHAGMEAIMQSVSVSHQFLTKPCEAEALRAAVNRACSLEALLQASNLREVLGDVVDLPTLPRVFEALTSALTEEEVDISHVGGIVEEDVGIAAKILQLVNTSYFGLRREITDLRQATSYLGINTIRDLVLCFGLFQQYDSSGMPAAFSLEQEQSHSFLTARIAKRLLTEKADQESAFLAAMLHDVGKLILATHLAESFETILKAGAGIKRPAQDIESEVLGTSHAEIGAYLLGLWGMPYRIVEAVAYHHHPARVSDQTTFGVLGATHVADALAREQSGCAPELVGLDEEYLQTLGVLDKLPEWRAMAAQEAGGDAEAA